MIYATGVMVVGALIEAVGLMLLPGAILFDSDATAKVSIGISYVGAVVAIGGAAWLSFLLLGAM